MIYDFVLFDRYISNILKQLTSENSNRPLHYKVTVHSLTGACNNKNRFIKLNDNLCPAGKHPPTSAAYTMPKCLNILTYIYILIVLLFTVHGVKSTRYGPGTVKVNIHKNI